MAEKSTNLAYTPTSKALKTIESTRKRTATKGASSSASNDTPSETAGKSKSQNKTAAAKHNGREAPYGIKSAVEIYRTGGGAQDPRASLLKIQGRNETLWKQRTRTSQA